MARIAIDAACWANRRGYGRYMRELLGELWRVDKENAYVLVADDRTAALPDFPKGIETVIVKLREIPTQAAGAGGSRSFGDLLAMGRAASKVDCDVFFFSSVYTFFPYWGPGRVALVIHDAIPERHPEQVFPDFKSRLFWRLKVAYAIRKAKRVIGVSEYTRREIAEVFRIPAERIGVVSEGPSRIFLEAFGSKPSAPLLERIGLEPGQPYFLWVGGFGPHKNLIRMLESFAEATNPKSQIQNPKSAQEAAATLPAALVMVGDYEKDSFLSNFAQVKAAAEAAGAGDRVKFPGFIADKELAALYAGCVALLLPSLREGFGLPAVEAAAAGAPVVATIHSPLPEVLEGGGIFVDPLDGESIAAAMRTMLDDPGARSKMAARARERAEAMSWELNARRLKAILESLCRKERAPAPRPAEWGQPMELEGVGNLHKISDSLYRSAQPTDDGMTRLQEAGIKTVLNLRNWHSDTDEIGEADLQADRIKMNAWSPTEEDAIEFLRKATDPDAAPILVHCMHGADRTGAMCAVYRIAVQGWTKEEAIHEMTKGGYGFHGIWKRLAEWIEELDIERLKEKAGLPRGDAGEAKG